MNGRGDCNHFKDFLVKIANFDCITSLDVERNKALTKKKLSGDVIGTLGYRAPEIAFECRENCPSLETETSDYFSPARDIWALGGVGLHIMMYLCCPTTQRCIATLIIMNHVERKAESMLKKNFIEQNKLVWEAVEIEILERAWVEHEWMLEKTAFNTRCVPRFGGATHPR